MPIIYYEDDADVNMLSGRVIGVIGYGRNSRPVALNLRHSGLKVMIGCDESAYEAAQSDGFVAAPIPTVVQQADVILLTVPDEDLPDVYMAQIAPHLRRRHTLILLSAYVIAFGFIEPPPFVDVGLVAPRTIDGTLAGRFSEQAPYSSFVAVWQDSSRQAWDMVLALAAALGALQQGAVEVSIEQEAELTLLVEQVLMPIFYHVMLTAFRLTMQAGYPLDAALVDLYLKGKFTHYMEKVADEGLLEALKSLSKSTQFGMLSHLDRFNDLKLERLMEITLEEIRSGDFAREWMRERVDNYPRLRKLLSQQEKFDLWELEQQTLDMLNRDKTV